MLLSRSSSSATLIVKNGSPKWSALRKVSRSFILRLKCFEREDLLLFLLIEQEAGNPLLVPALTLPQLVYNHFYHELLVSKSFLLYLLLSILNL
jgi:hypothetical protein